MATGLQRRYGLLGWNVFGENGPSIVSRFTLSSLRRFDWADRSCVFRYYTTVRQVFFRYGHRSSHVLSSHWYMLRRCCYDGCSGDCALGIGRELLLGFLLYFDPPPNTCSDERQEPHGRRPPPSNRPPPPLLDGHFFVQQFTHGLPALVSLLLKTIMLHSAVRIWLVGGWWTGDWVNW